MADNLIPGLDGDLPSDRGLLPDSLQGKTSNGETVGYSGQQGRPGQPADPTATHPKVKNGRYLGYYFATLFKVRVALDSGCCVLYVGSYHFVS